jgi:hypothetical protein
MKLFDGGLLFLAILIIFGYGTSVLERAADDDGKVDTEVAKTVVDKDIDYVTDTASKAWAARTPLDYSELND